MTRPSLEAVAVAVQAALTADGLQTALTDATGLTAPYVVVHPTGVDLDGPVADRHADGLHDIQVTVVAGAARGVEALKDRVLDVLLDQPLTVAGRAVTVWHETVFGPDVDRTTEPPVFVGGVIVSVWNTPNPPGA